MRRKLLGTASNLATRVRVYLAEDAVEIDEIEGYSGTRKRVLFDEVLLVTLDRRRRMGSLLIWGGLALFFTAIAGASLVVGSRPAPLTGALLLMALLGGPFWLVFLAHLALGVDHVTVFGKRSTAQIRFSLRKRRAREVFALLTNRVRDAQRGAAAAPQSPVPPASDASGTAVA